MDRNQFLINYRQSIGDITGWQSLIFLPFYIFWQFLMFLVGVYSFLRVFYYFAYDVRPSFLLYVGYITDLIYLLDVFTAFLHFAMVKTRKLKKYKPRKWYLFVVDIISLAPIEIAYENIIINEKKDSSTVHRYLHFNKVFRTYKIYTYFAEVKPSLKRWYSIAFVSYFEIALYHFLASYMYGCIWVHLGSELEKKKCKMEIIWCMLRDHTNMLRLTTHQFNGKFNMIDSYPRRIVALISILTGYVIIYGFSIPILIYTFLKILRPFFEISNRLIRLRKFAGNMISSKDLREKTVKHFRAVWTYGRGEEEPEIMKKFPLALRKDISTDIHWEAFRHSNLLRDMSTGCKRSIALVMRTDFVVPNTTFHDFGDKKRHMIYLASGVLQIQSEENSKSPVLSFSAGTVLNEIGLFFWVKNKAILRSATFSQLGILEAVDFFRILRDYPRDKKIVFRRLRRRFEIARLMRLRKQPIYQDLKILNEEISAGLIEDEDHIKWIKRQCRALTSLHIRDGILFRSKREGASLELPKTNIDHTSKYLEMISLSDSFEVKTDVVCLKTSFPWVIDPDSQFLGFWRYFILFIVLFTTVSYPYFIGWYAFFPDWFLDITFIVTLIYLIDVMIQMSMAIKTKDVVIIDLIDRLVYRLQSVTFYLDITAALPLHIIYHLAVSTEKQKPYNLNVFAAIALVKCYRLYLYLQDIGQKTKVSIVSIIMIKYIFFLCFFTYCVAVAYEITGVKCVYKETCHPNDWYALIPPQNDKAIASVYYAVCTGTMTPARDFTTTSTFSTILLLSFTSFFVFFVALWHGEYIAAYILDTSNELNFKGLIENVLNFLKEREISHRITKRVLAMMKFQWFYDYGDYFTQERSMLEDAPEQLRLEIDRDTVLKTFKKCDFVADESEDFIRTLSSKGKRVAFPSGSVICTFGNQTMQLFLVHKGYCQLNSFLREDIKRGFGSVVLSGPGRIFPVIVAMNQIPSAVTVLTLTDCELVVIELEDLLDTLIEHEAFKDTVEALKTTDFTGILEAKIAQTQKTEHRISDEEYKSNFARYKCIGPLLRLFLLKRAINHEKSSYGRWELSRVICLSISILLWPIIHGLFMYPEKIIALHILFVLDILAWIDIYIRMNVSYRNSKGIKVTHTLKTMTHYLKTSFVTDIIASPPFHHIYRFVHYGFSDMSSILKTSPTLVVIHILMRLVGLYRIYGYITVREGFSRSDQKYKFIKYLFFLLIFLNTFVNIEMLYDVTWIYNKDENKYAYHVEDYSWMSSSPVSNLTEPYEVYLIILYATVILTFRNDFFFKIWNPYTVIVEIIMGLFGWVVVKIIFALFNSNFTSSNLNFTIYQDRMACFLDFLYNEKAEDAIIKEAVEHFEYEWAKMRGENLQKVFSRFPNVLQEDLTYPLYINTIRSVDCLSRANSAFYRQLSRSVTEVHFRKGSLIIFEKQVQNNIYFVHAGKCLVYNHSVTLFKGSMIGDIRKTGLMKNNIYATTHTHCLVISSESFYGIVNNFFETEYAFMEHIKEIEDYIESRHGSSRGEKYRGEGTFRLRGTAEYQESFFEEITADRLLFQGQEISLTKKTARKLKTIIHPNSRIKFISKIVLSVNAYLTICLLLVFVPLHAIPLGALIFFYILDFLWLLKIILTLRTGYFDIVTGDLITNSKLIAKKYLRKFDGLLTDILLVLPLEMIPVMYGYANDVPINYMICLYLSLVRLLRIIFLIRFISEQSRKLSMRYFYRWFIIFGIQIFLLHILVAIYITFATDPKVDIPGIHWTWGYKQSEALLWSYLHVANLFAGAGLVIFKPVNKAHVIIVITISIAAVCGKALFINQVSAILNVIFHSKSEYLHKLQLLENYLHSRNISPHLLRSTREYCVELLKSYRAASMPQFLMEAPLFLKVAIMQDLYLSHLNSCYVFQGLGLDFLKQLTARLERFIYFPGDKIVEKGDVDLNIYFVHRGEVSCMDYDDEFPALEYPVDIYQADEYFGLLQGLYLATPHTHTYRARTVADILVLNHSNWTDIRLAFPEFTQIIYSRARAARNATRTYIEV